MKSINKDQAMMNLISFIQNVERSKNLFKNGMRPPIEVAMYNDFKIGTYMPVEMLKDQNLLRYLDDGELERIFTNASLQIADFDVNSPDSMTYFTMQPKTISSAITKWRNMSISMLDGKVKPFCFKSDPCFTFRRVPFDLNDHWVEMPTFETIFENMTNRDAFLALIGSIFYGNSYNQQYAYLCGEGGDGKGTILRVLEYVLSSKLYHAVNHIPLQINNFFTSQFIGRRVVAFTENESGTLLQSALFKALTGNDLMNMEMKHGKIYSARLNLKILIASNQLPAINSKEANKRRIICCNFESGKKQNKIFDFENKILAEIPAFISNCVIMFNELVPDIIAPIPAEYWMFDKYAEEFDEELHAFIEGHFIVDPTFCCKLGEFHRLRNAHLARISLRRIQEFMAFKGFKKSRDKDVRFYIGLKSRWEL